MLRGKRKVRESNSLGPTFCSRPNLWQLFSTFNNIQIYKLIQRFSSLSIPNQGIKVKSKKHKFFFILCKTNQIYLLLFFSLFSSRLPKSKRMKHFLFSSLNTLFLSFLPPSLQPNLVSTTIFHDFFGDRFFKDK